MSTRLGNVVITVHTRRSHK